MTDQEYDAAMAAPRVSPEHIESLIVEEHYLNFSGSQPMELLTICVLVLKNGFTIVGHAACAHPDNFEAEMGREIARRAAFDQIWPLEGYLLKELIHQAEQKT